MKKRLISLLVLTIVIANAPAALADHCRRCRPADQKCVIAATGGNPFCDDSSGTCVLSGPRCTGPHPLLEPTSLASEFTVASVERLDEPQTAASPTQVASLETTPAVSR